jgi:3-(3-hydroxy-phenyl)propionate hydroxylase
VADGAQRIAAKYGAHAGTVYVLRPDLHVCARWLNADAAQVCRAMRVASQVA